MSAARSEAVAVPKELTIKVRRPRVAVGALLWSGIMLSSLLALTYTPSFANYGRPDAGAKDQEPHDAPIRTNGDPSVHREDYEDRGDEVKDDEDDEENGGEDEDLSPNSAGARTSKSDALQKEAARVPEGVARKGSTTKFWETIPAVLGDEIPSRHATPGEASEPELESSPDEDQRRLNSSAHAHAVGGARSSSTATAGPPTSAARVSKSQEFNEPS